MVNKLCRGTAQDCISAGNFLQVEIRDALEVGLFACTYCKNRSVLSTLICPNTHTKTLSVCVLGQINVFNTCTSIFTVHVHNY